MPRVAVLIEDDWELHGDGSGNVASHQYLPARFLMGLAENLGIKLTFMVEVLQQLQFLEEAVSSSDIASQARLWEDTVRDMKLRGFDVQLHLHPQWVNAAFDGDRFSVRQGWNIGTYSQDSQRAMVEAGSGYLRSLLKEIDSEYQLMAFKGGNWGLQPSKSLLTVLESNGIRWVLGACKDLWVPTQGTDYRVLQESIRPYNPDFDDIRKTSPTSGGITVLPLAHAYLSPYQVIRVAGSRAIQRLARSTPVSTLHPKATGGTPGSPGGKRKPVFRGLNLAYHVQLGNLPFSVMKTMFNEAYRRVSSVDAEVVPLVIESHTKGFGHSYKSIQLFLEYLVREYGSRLEFHDVTSFDRVFSR